MWIHRFAVSGKGYFPMDMLRYDMCYPSDSQSAVQISAAIRSDSQEYLRERTTVELIHTDRMKGWEPTKARWQSFGWTVTEHLLPSKL